jgi:hypothetical protein
MRVSTHARNAAITGGTGIVVPVHNLWISRRLRIHRRRHDRRHFARLFDRMRV